MPTTITQLPPDDLGKPIRLGDDRRDELSGYLTREIEDALSSRRAQENVWNESLRLYESVPERETRSIPIENAPNIEISLTATAADAIYAQAIDLIFGTTPLLTIRAGEPHVQAAKALQRFTNRMTSQMDVFGATQDALLDVIQLGTGIYYTPWIETTKRTDINRIVQTGPRGFGIPPEDYIVPGGAGAMDFDRWCSYRTWPTFEALTARARAGGWDIGGVVSAGGVDFVRHQRERLGRTSITSNRVSNLYEIHDVHALYDIDGDGMDEDLLIFWDRTSRKVLKAMWNPYDRRPFNVMRYQPRAHLFYGIGVVEQLRQHQRAATETLNYWLANMLLANCRFMISRTGTLEGGTTRLWPGRNIETSEPDQVKVEEFADVYNSGPLALQMIIQFAEQRTGISGSSSAKPSQIMSSRTPATTALTAQQNVNRRFAAAFNQMRMATAGMVKQGLYRYSEHVLANDTATIDYITRVLGDETEAQGVLALLRDPDFDDEVTVELTASSASVNRDVDKQNAMMLVQIMMQYYERVVQLSMITANPQVPPEIQSVAKQIMEKAGEVMDRTLRTFDQVRDPQAFIIEMEGEVDALGGLDQQGLAGLGGLTGLLGQGTPATNGALGPPIQ